MKLSTVKISNFRSIEDSEIIFNHSCIGLVGINESGKSNILDAINSLYPDNELKISDIPKNSVKNPEIIFEFSLSYEELNSINDEVENYVESNSLSCTVEAAESLSIEYRIFLNNEGKEKRQFKILGLEINKDYRFLIHDFKNGKYKLLSENSDKPIEETLLITKDQLEEEHQNIVNNIKLKEIRTQIEDLQEELSNLEEEEGGKEEAQINAKIATFQKDEATLESLITFDIIEYVKELEEVNRNKKIKLKEHEQSKVELEAKLEELESTSDDEDPDEDEKDTVLEDIKIEEANVSKLLGDIQLISNSIDQAFYDINKNYTDDKSVFDADIAFELEEELEHYLPEVILWQPTSEYILPSKIKLDDLLAEKKSRIPRPLLNIFRISLGVKNEEQFIELLERTKKLGNVRSSTNLKLNAGVNKYIKSVWKEYDQDLLITLEENQIRIEVFDPSREADASFYL